MTPSTFFFFFSRIFPGGAKLFSLREKTFAKKSRRRNSNPSHTNPPTPTITHHPSPITHHPSPINHHPSPITHQPLPVTRHPSPVTRHPSPITHYPSSITHHPHQPLTTTHTNHVM
jgi:hypothetical protein